MFKFILFAVKNVMVYNSLPLQEVHAVGRLILRVDRKPVITTVTHNLGTINFIFFILRILV